MRLLTDGREDAGRPLVAGGLDAVAVRGLGVVEQLRDVNASAAENGRPSVTPSAPRTIPAPIIWATTKTTPASAPWRMSVTSNGVR